MDTAERSELGIMMGGCLCGDIRYRISGKPLSMFCCHCLNCQKQSGGPMMMVFAVAPEQFVLTAGQMSSYAATEKGVRKFCTHCGSAILFERAKRPAAYGVFAGTLDDPRRFSPSRHLFDHRKASWLELPGLAARERGRSSH
jgi:hypothetical protein